MLGPFRTDPRLCPPARAGLSCPRFSWLQSAVDRVTSLPLLSSAFNLVSSAYSHTKESHPCLGGVCSVAETVAAVAMGSVVGGAQPILSQLEPQSECRAGDRGTEGGTPLCLGVTPAPTAPSPLELSLPPCSSPLEGSDCFQQKCSSIFFGLPCRAPSLLSLTPSSDHPRQFETELSLVYPNTFQPFKPNALPTKGRYCTALGLKSTVRKLGKQNGDYLDLLS